MAEEECCWLVETCHIPRQLGQDCWVLEGWHVSCGIRWWTTVTTDIASAVDLLWEGWGDNYFTAHRGILWWFAKTCLSSFHLCFYLALFVYVVFLCVCVRLSLSFSLSFLSSSVRMPRLQAPDNVDTNTCILQGALGSTEALQLSAHSVHIFQIMGWTPILKEDLTGNTYVESLSETHHDHIFHLWFWKAVPGFAHGFLALALLPCCIRLRHVNSIGKSLGCPVAHGVALRSSSQLGGALKMFANWSFSQESLLEDKQELIKQHLQWPMIWVWRQDSPRVVIHCLLTVDKHRTTVGS
jgi:hypothetical protein